MSSKNPPIPEDAEAIRKGWTILLGALVGVASAAAFYLATGSLNPSSTAQPANLEHFYSISDAVPGLLFGIGLAILFLFRPESKKRKIVFSLGIMLAGLVSYDVACWVTFTSFNILFVLGPFAPTAMAGVGGFVGTLVLMLTLRWLSDNRFKRSDIKFCLYGGVVAGVLMNLLVWAGGIGVWVFFIGWQTILLTIIGADLLRPRPESRVDGEPFAKQSGNVQARGTMPSRWITIGARILLCIAGFLAIYYALIALIVASASVSGQVSEPFRYASILGWILLSAILLAVFFVSTVLFKSKKYLLSIVVSFAVLILAVGFYAYGDAQSSGQQESAMHFACSGTNAPKDIAGNTLDIRKGGELTDSWPGANGAYGVLGTIDDHAKTFTWWTYPDVPNPGSPYITEVNECTNSNNKTVADLYTIVPPTPF